MKIIVILTATVEVITRCNLLKKKGQTDIIHTLTVALEARASIYIAQKQYKLALADAKEAYVNEPGLYLCVCIAICK